ncbi:MAG: T9SS type A sorting domain-containing protein [Rhodothermales bacterium]
MRLAAALLAFLFTEVAAQPGTLDASFGDGGIVTTNVGASFYQVGRDVVTQPDGKIVVAAVLETSSAEGRVLVRYLPDGTLDPDFGDGGVALLPPGDLDFSLSLALHPDGALIAVYSGPPFVVARILPNGTPDPSFGENGVVSTHIGESGGIASGVVVQPDGRILVAGRARDDGSRYVAVVRYLPDGGLDPAFGDGGVATFSSAPFGDGVAAALVLQEDGKIVLAGFTGDSPRQVAVLRLSPSGLLDGGFGAGGLAVASIGSEAVAEAVAIQSDGRIVAAGYAREAEQPADFAVVRFLPDGALDAAFGEGGTVVTALSGGTDLAQDVLVQPDGKLVAAGYTSNEPGQSTEQRFALVRFLSDGTPDPAFGGDGIVTEPGGAEDDIYVQACGLTLGVDDRLIAAGMSGSAVVVARFEPDGTLDADFGEDGVVRSTGLGPGDDHARTLLIQPDGKLIVVGHADTHDDGLSPRSSIIVARYEETGALDATFGAEGTTATRTPGPLSYVADAVLQPDGRVVVGGSTHRAGASGLDFVLARYLPDGTPDPDFGEGGVVAPPIAPNVFSSAVLRTDDGRLIVVGYAAYDVLLARYLPNGGLDASFGSGGVLSADLGGLEQVGDAALQPDGKIIVVGRRLDSCCPYEGLALFVARLEPNGSLDASFGEDGVVILPEKGASAVALQGDGRIIVGGWSNGFAVFGFSPNGALEWSRTVGAGSSARAVAVQPDGRIVATGSTSDGALITARLLPGGTLDTAFGTGGYIITATGTGAYYDAPADVAVHPNERIVVTGSTWSELDYDLVLLAYEAGEFVAAESPVAIGDAARLSVWPNPAWGAATVAITAAQRGVVRVTVYDVLGRRVALLHDGPLPAGEHRIALDGSDLPSGIYLVRATFGGLHLTRRVTIAR